MARKNRRLHADGYLVPTLLIGLLVLTATGCLLYLSLRGKAEALGREIKKLETQRTALRERLRVEESEWSRIRAPGNVVKALEIHGIQMTWPRQEQIVRIGAPSTMARNLKGELAGVTRRQPTLGTMLHD